MYNIHRSLHSERDNATEKIFNVYLHVELYAVYHRQNILLSKIFFSGELAENFSVLVRVMHSGQFKFVSPGEFKRTVGKFKSQFSGYDQQDSQELLAFLMDGLQEDLNKVPVKFFWHSHSVCSTST